MSVDFEEENNFNKTFLRRETSIPFGGINGWLIKKGFAKDKKGGDKIMIVLSIIFFVIAIYFRIK